MNDTQLIEFAGRNWLAAQLQRAGIEVARPERDRGIDLIAYVDLDRHTSGFLARPIQLKVATEEGFSLDPKYSKFPDLILAYVWHIHEPARTVCYALTYVSRQFGGAPSRAGTRCRQSKPRPQRPAGAVASAGGRTAKRFALPKSWDGRRQSHGEAAAGDTPPRGYPVDYAPCWLGLK